MREFLTFAEFMHAMTVTDVNPGLHGEEIGTVELLYRKQNVRRQYTPGQIAAHFGIELPLVASGIRSRVRTQINYESS